MAITRFTLFSHLWAIAGFCEWHRWTWTESGGSDLLLLSSIALFVFPNSVACLAIYATTQAVFAAFAMNSPWNHGLFMAFLNLSLLATIARCGYEQRGASDWDREKIIDTFAPALRVALIVLYLWTAFHKVNADFLNPDVSCAGALMSWMNEVYRFLPLDRWAVSLAIAGTLFVEFTVPILLCFRRTAYAGLLLGAGFHLFLSQYGGLHGFAAMLFALYFLFLPKAFTERVAERTTALLARFDERLLRAALPALALGGLVVGKALGHFAGLNYTERGLLYWDLWLVAVIALFWREIGSVWQTPADFTLRQRWAPLALLPLVVLANGAMPYLGLKTETSWAMYSNLRTATSPNHLWIPESARIFGFQDALYTITATNHPTLEAYAGEPVALQRYELQRILSSSERDFTVEYVVAGEAGSVTVIDGVSSDPALTTPVPWYVGRALRFRPVDTGRHAHCRH